MNELALFAGAGGGILATQAIGISTVCGVELDWYCRSVLIRRQNDRLLKPFPIWDDVCTFDGKPWFRSIDIVSGGFPCQAFSTVAHGKNNAVNLWPEMRRIIGEIRPKFVFAENVSRKAIEKATKDCAKMGYKADMLPLSAKDLGADHIRQRYWLLAYSDDKSELRRLVNAEVAKRSSFCSGVWETEPGESRMADGVAHKVERFRAIGNGQVPVVAIAALWALANA